MTRLALAPFFVAAVLAVSLTACGGGGGASSSTARAQAQTTTATTTTPASPQPATKARFSKPPPPRKPHPPRALIRKAGRAAPFLVAVGDNSIPTYGTESSPSQQSAATAALGAYLTARARGDWSTACSYLGARERTQLQALAATAQDRHPSCTQVNAKIASGIPASQRADPLTGALAAFRVKGGKAFALFYGPHHHKYMMPMVAEGGVWKVTQAAPLPWPIGSSTPPTG